ncbi:MAG: protein-export chaperone SecB, partial [Reyranella sp.]|nr:protein-export chaperone SecB [Reyranella sp.]
MTTTPPPAPPAPDQPQAVAPLTMHGQYIKDLSFENPRAPQSLIEQTQPQLTLNVQVTNRQFDAKTFEVALTIEASAQT